MTVTFRCKQSGNCVSFSVEDDITAMRKETEYEEVKDAVQEEIKAPAKEVTNAIAHGARRGRPPKAVEQQMEV